MDKIGLETVLNDGVAKLRVAQKSVALQFLHIIALNAFHVKKFGWTYGKRIPVCP